MTRVELGGERRRQVERPRLRRAEADEALDPLQGLVDLAEVVLDERPQLAANACVVGPLLDQPRVGAQRAQRAAHLVRERHQELAQRQAERRSGRRWRFGRSGWRRPFERGLGLLVRQVDQLELLELGRIGLERGEHQVLVGRRFGLRGRRRLTRRCALGVGRERGLVLALQRRFGRGRSRWRYSRSTHQLVERAVELGQVARPQTVRERLACGGIERELAAAALERGAEGGLDDAPADLRAPAAAAARPGATAARAATGPAAARRPPNAIQRIGSTPSAPLAPRKCASSSCRARDARSSRAR